MPRVVIVGCSGHARVVVDILELENRCHIVGLLDSVKPPGTEVLGYQVIGSDEDLPALVNGDICNGIIVAIGDNWVRSRMVARIKQMLPANYNSSRRFIRPRKSRRVRPLAPAR